MKSINTLSLSSFIRAVEHVDLEKIFLIAATIIAGFLITRLVWLTVKKVFASRINPQTGMLINKLISYTGFVTVLMIVLNQMGLSLATILGAAGVMGVIIGVASQKSIGNIISGLFMVTEKSFEIGDAITVAGQTGIVYSVELLSIMLKTFDNMLIRIPHETLISSEIVNITKFPVRRMDFVFTVSYDQDIPHVLNVLEKIAKENAYTLDEPLPMILVRRFKESGVEIQLGVWFEKEHYVEIKNTVSSEILKRFREEGISIPYPHITISNFEGKAI